MNQAMMSQIAQIMAGLPPASGDRKQQLWSEILSQGAAPSKSGGIGNVLKGAVQGVAAMPRRKDGEATSRDDESLREDPFQREEGPVFEDEYGPAFEGDNRKKPSLPPWTKWLHQLFNPPIGNLASAGGGTFLGKLLSKAGGGRFG